MPLYSYVAKSQTGEEKNGKLEAKTVRELAGFLREQGFVLVHAFLEKSKTKRNIFDISIPFLNSVPLSEKMMFVRNLKVMIAAGLSIPRAVNILALQTENKRFKKVLTDIEQKIIKGTNFSEALVEFSDVFSDLFQNMIKVGEEAGNLEEVLDVLARQMEREYELKSKVKAALMYPAIIIFAMVMVGVLMLVMVVPRLAETFEELGVELPLTTRIIIFIGTFMAEKWYFLLVILIFFIFLFAVALKRERFRRMFDGIILKTPMLSAIIKKVNSATTVRTLSSLVSAGVPIVRSLQIVANTLSNSYYKKVMIEASERVGKGEKLSDILKPHQDLYPVIVVQMIKVGEETGETSSILVKLADFFEEEVSNATKNIASIIEPVLMLIIGAVIGFFAISMVQPMYSMLGTI
ncbi:MAG: type II secretion system F family protein [Candidatus Portnoybacteria bacterium]